MQAFDAAAPEISGKNNPDVGRDVPTRVPLLFAYNKDDEEPVRGLLQSTDSDCRLVNVDELLSEQLAELHAVVLAHSSKVFKLQCLLPPSVRDMLLSDAER